MRAINPVVKKIDNKSETKSPAGSDDPDHIMTVPFGFRVKPRRALHRCDIVCFHAYNIAHIGIHVKP